MQKFPSPSINHCIFIGRRCEVHVLEVNDSKKTRESSPMRFIQFSTVRCRQAVRQSPPPPPSPPPPTSLPPASQHCGSSPALPWPGSKDNEALEVRTPTERRRQRSDITGWSVCGRAVALGAAAGLTLHRGRAPPAR